MSKDAAFFCGIYGPAKSGKTSATIKMVVGDGIALGGSNDLIVAQTFLGVTDDKLRFARVWGLSGDKGMIKGLKSAIKAKPFGILIDDLSVRVEEELKGQSGNTMWKNLSKNMIELRDMAREATDAGINVFWTAHEQPQRVSSGKRVRGGPKFPGQMPETFSGLVDIIGRATFNEDSPLWKYSITFGPQKDWISGDRKAVFPEISPMNLAEGYRYAGIDVPRPKSLTWMEAIVQGLSDAILAAGYDNWQEVIRKAAPKLMKYPKPHVQWLIADALDRAYYKHMNSADMFLQNILDSGEESGDIL